MKTSLIPIQWLCLLVLMSACGKSDNSERRQGILAKQLLNDGVVTSIESVRLLDSTDHWRENSFLIEVPSKNISAKVLKDRDSWNLVLSNVSDPAKYQDSLRSPWPFAARKPDPGGKKNIFFGFGKGCWYSVIVGEGEKSFVVRDNY